MGLESYVVVTGKLLEQDLWVYVRKFAMRRLIALAVTATFLAPGTAAAAAKPGPVRLVKTTGDGSLTAVVAPSRRSAFAFGSRRHRTWTEPLAYRWNGRTWKRAGLPKGVTGAFGEAE